MQPVFNFPMSADSTGKAPDIGQRSNAEARIEALQNSKRTIAKMFGLGKSTKSKPGPLLENARALYDNLKKELNENDE